MSIKTMFNRMMCKIAAMDKRPRTILYTALIGGGGAIMTAGIVLGIVVSGLWWIMYGVGNVFFSFGVATVGVLHRYRD